MVFALDPSCPAPFNAKAEKVLGIRCSMRRESPQAALGGNE